MAQFATHSDLAIRLGVDLTDAEQERAGTLLAAASGLVQAEARQVIELVTDDELTRRGTGDRTLLLPERPVVSVRSITVDGTAIDSDGWYLDGNEIVLHDGSFGRPDQELVIVYTHGYDPVPELVKAITLEVAVRVWVNPGSVMQERHGSESYTYQLVGTPGGLLLTRDESRAIRKAFGRAAGAVTLR